jgi:NitT/TauT family transport system substrate-binding protein
MPMTYARALLRPWTALALGAVLTGLAACTSPAPGRSGTGAAAPTAAPAPQSAASSPSPTAPVEVVKQGIVGVVSDAGILIGIERGYFREAGITIEGTRIGSASEAIQFLATGQLDVLGGGPGVGLYNAFAQGSRLRVVADKGSALNERFGLNPLLVRKDLYDSGQLRDFSQLRGKRVGLSGLTTTNRVDINKILERGGLTEADIELTAMSFPDMVPALANGNIDFAIANEPSASVAIERGAAVRIGTVADIYPNHQVAMLMYSEQFATQRRAVAQRYMVAYLRGIRDYNDAFVANRDKADIVRILGETTGITDPAIYEKIVLPGLNPNGYVFKETLAEDQTWFLRLGLQREPVDIDQLVDNQFVEYALAQLGPYQGSAR